MAVLDFTGVKPETANAVISELSGLLANYQVLYTNTRGFHWNIKGRSFFVLHEKFEELYDNFSEKIDEIAERILALGGIPSNNFSQYLGVSAIKEVSEVSGPKEAVANILESFKMIIAKEREIKKLADANGDDVTSDLVTGYISEQEKTVWMLVSFLQEEIMTEKRITDRDVKIIYIPPMTVASIHCIGGSNPELESIININKFIQEKSLDIIKPDFRHFGFNHSNATEHGYERWVSVPESMEIAAPFIKKQFCGGLYAAYMIPMGLFEEWKLFKEWMSHEKYKIVPSGLEYTDGLMEEHLNWINKYKSIPSYNDQSIRIDLLIPIEEKVLE